MKYIKNTLDFHVEKPTVISLGKFDGIHRGHELLMEKLAQKKEEGLKAAIFTFDIPPKKNVEHIEAKVLTTNEEKMHIFEGISHRMSLYERSDVHGTGRFYPYARRKIKCKMYRGRGRFSFWTQQTR